MWSEALAEWLLRRWAALHMLPVYPRADVALYGPHGWAPSPLACPSCRLRMS